MNQKTERLNLRISPNEAAKLKALVAQTDASSSTEVIRRALAVYEHLWQAKDAKKEVVIRDEDGDESKLMLL